MTDTSNSRSDEDANKLLAELVEIENYANAIDDYQTNFEQRHIASAVQLARIDMLKTFMAYEEKQPGYINWDFLDGELTSIELQSKLEDKE